jgi:glycosyltransferase involved in cell wall biosynthesis
MDRRFGFDSHSIQLSLDRKDAFFIVAGWREYPSLALLSALALSGRRFALWTDTPNLRPRSFAPKAMLRKGWLSFLFSRATKVMSTGRPGIEALAAMGVPSGKIVDFPFFVDLERFTPSRVSLQGTTVFLSVGRLVNSLKGHDVALRALAIVRGEVGQDLPVEYWIAGDGPDRSALERLARELNLGELKLIPWLESAELSDFYRSGNVLLHPSRFDPFPVATLEAMACGIPVFGSDVSGAVIDRVVDGMNGRIHQAGNVEALAAQMIWAIANPGEVRRMGKEARTTAEQFPFSVAVDRLRAVVESP